MSNMGLPLKVASLNVQSAVASTTFKKRLYAELKYYFPHSQKPLRDIGRFLLDERVDIATFQEINGVCLRSNGRHQLSSMLEGSPLIHQGFFPNYSVFPIINQGNAIASRFPMTYQRNHILPRGLENRSLGEAKVQTPKGELHVLTTHLSLTKGARKEQVDYILDRVSSLPSPLVLTLDSNMIFLSETSCFKEAGLKMVSFTPTYPTWSPSFHLDRIFYKGIHLRQAYVGNHYKVSDHLPIFAEFELR